QTRLAREVIENFTLVPYVITAGEHVAPESKQIFRDRGRYAEASRGVFRVGDYQIDRIGLDDIFQMIGDNASARGAKNVPDKKNVNPVGSTVPCGARTP